MDTKRQNARFMCFGKNWKLTAIFLKYSINWISVPRMTHTPLSILFRAIIVCKTKWPTAYFLPQNPVSISTSITSGSESDDFFDEFEIDLTFSNILFFLSLLVGTIMMRKLVALLDNFSVFLSMLVCVLRVVFIHWLWVTLLLLPYIDSVEVCC